LFHEMHVKFLNRKADSIAKIGSKSSKFSNGGNGGGIELDMIQKSLNQLKKIQ